MKIIKITLQRLHGEEHFQFHTHFKSILEPLLSLIPNLDSLREKYQTLYEEEDLVLEQLSKSVFTDKIAEADKLRDTTFKGFRNAVRNMQQFPDKEKVDAANKLMLVFKKYGDVHSLPYHAETAAIYNLVQDMDDKYSSEIGLLQLREWIIELNRLNRDFDNMILQRFDEKNDKPASRLTEVRKSLDTAYADLVKSVEVFLLVNQNPTLEEAIKKFNIVIKDYKNVLAQRKGRKKIVVSG